MPRLALSASPRARVRGLLPRSVVVTLVLAFLSLGLGAETVGADSDSAQLARTRRELVAIRQKLTRAKGEAAAIKGQVRALDKQIAALNGPMGGGTRAIPGLESST